MNTQFEEYQILSVAFVISFFDKANCLKDLNQIGHF